jgi:hypothetical protein
VGRKNHYGSKSRRGTTIAEILYTLVETATASNPTASNPTAGNPTAGNPTAGNPTAGSAARAASRRAGAIFRTVAARVLRSARRTVGIITSARVESERASRQEQKTGNQSHDETT